MGLTSQNKRRRMLVARQNLKEPLEKGKHNYDSLKSLSRSEQCILCKELGLKGYTTVKEDARIKMILNNQ